MRVSLTKSFGRAARIPRWRGGLLGLVLASTSLGVGLTGCAPQGVGSLEQANGLYAGGEYRLAYEEARRVMADRTQSARADEAAYVAGLSAHKLGETSRAIRYLDQASQAGDARTAFDAAVSLGSVYTEAGRHDHAAGAFHRASELSGGDDQARALFYAAVAEQKLGRWDSARTTLWLVIGKAQDPALRRQAEEQLTVTGYTIQAGAYRDAANANQTAERIAARAAELGLGAPRLVSRRGPDGRTVTLVQVGEFGTFEHAVQNVRRLGEPAVVVKLAGVSP
ncbi:MAG: SPOR domain-containing protein [Planctomycetota bacterium]